MHVVCVYDVCVMSCDQSDSDDDGFGGLNKILFCDPNRKAPRPSTPSASHQRKNTLPVAYYRCDVVSHCLPTPSWSCCPTYCPSGAPYRSCLTSRPNSHPCCFCCLSYISGVSCVSFCLLFPASGTTEAPCCRSSTTQCSTQAT